MVSTKTIMLAVMLGGMLAGCTTAPPTPDPAAAIAASKVETAGASKVGAASRPGFCTFKTASGSLYEAKC